MGVNWFRRGAHWTRLPRSTEISAESNAELIRIARRLTDYRINERSLLRLINAVALAHRYKQDATRQAATINDTKVQLKAMLKLDNDSLTKAIEDCDAGTLAVISVAQAGMMFDPETKWVACYDPDSIPGEVLAPESVRRSVEVALLRVQTQKGKRGPKEKPYRRDLARTCVAVWRECRPPRSPGRLEFARAAFEAAGMYLDDKSLEALLSTAVSRSN